MNPSYETDAMVLLVTHFGDLHVTNEELAESQAVFSTRGKPLNKEAKILMDFASWLCLDSWARANAVRGLR